MWSPASYALALAYRRFVSKKQLNRWWPFFLKLEVRPTFQEEEELRSMSRAGVNKVYVHKTPLVIP